jgi:hypothetical protein
LKNSYRFTEGPGNLWVRKVPDFGLGRSNADYCTRMPFFPPLPVSKLSMHVPTDSSDLVTNCGSPLSAIILSERHWCTLR